MTTKPSLTVSRQVVRADEAVVGPAPKPMLGSEALEAFFRAHPPSVPVVSRDGLDGWLTAILIGPKFIDPRLWLGRLLGDAALMAEADTPEHLALQAVVDHHNRLSVMLSEQPDRYRPMFKPHREGGVDTLSWALGFQAGIELAPRAWKPLTDPRRPEHTMIAPILDAAFRSGPGRDDTVQAVADAILAIRRHFLPKRIKSR